VKGLEKLAQLEKLYLQDNPNLTKAQIAELQKALPKCNIYSNPRSNFPNAITDTLTPATAQVSFR